MRLAIFDTPLLLVCGECLSAPHLIAGKDNLLHGRRDRKILCRHIEDAIQHECEFLRLAMLVFAHNAEEIVLQFVSRDVGERFVAKGQLQVHAEGTFVFLIS